MRMRKIGVDHNSKGLWIASIYGFIISVPCFMCFLLHYWFN